MVQIKIYPSKYQDDKVSSDGLVLYPSNHTIQLKNEAMFDTDLKIPLSYINLDYTKYKIDKSFNFDFQKSDSDKNIMMTPLLPGQKVENSNTFVFNRFEERVKTDGYYKEIGDAVYYTPIHEFIPNYFSYEVTIKRNMIYNSSKLYNINVGCLDDADSLDLSSRLSSIFSNPADRQYVPNEISINENRESMSALIDMSYDNADFMFIESFDGFYLDRDRTETIDINRFLDNNINVWVGCEEHHLYKNRDDNLGYLTFNTSASIKDFNFKKTSLIKTTTVHSDHYFNMNRTELSSTQNKLFYNIFVGPLSPVLIIEHVGRGFEIISHNDILQDPVKHKDLIFEVMMYVYLLSYKRSKRVTEWITYTCPNYEVINGKLYEKTNFSSHISLSELFEMEVGDYSIYQVDIYDANTNELPVPNTDLVNTINNITYTNVINNKLVFEMKNKGDSNNVYTEVDMPLGWISIYKDGKIYYAEQLFYYIESDITHKVFIIEKENSLIVKLYPFKSSKYNIDLRVNKQVEIKNIKTTVNGELRAINETYSIYFNPTTEELGYCIKDDFETVDKTNVKLLDIFIHQDIDNVFLTDMRQLGGGLRKDSKPDYDLLDIGHIDGRPYRKANTLIITMPKKYEPYKDQILAAINKYKIGEDYPVIFFKDDEE